MTRKTKKYSLEEFQNYAMSKGGECLSKEFMNIKTPLEFKCKNGHVFKSVIRLHETKSKASEIWCRTCYYKEKAGTYHKLGIEDCHKLAEKFGGRCLSTQYKNARTLMQWECKHKHVFEKTYDSISGQNLWCKQCNLKTGISEKLVRKLFVKLFQVPFHSKKPSWLKNPKTGYRLELDGFNEDLNIAFEFKRCSI